MIPHCGQVWSFVSLRRWDVGRFQMLTLDSTRLYHRRLTWSQARFNPILLDLVIFREVGKVNRIEYSWLPDSARFTWSLIDQKTRSCREIVIFSNLFAILRRRSWWGCWLIYLILAWPETGWHFLFGKTWLHSLFWLSRHNCCTTLWLIESA